jgi:hypothetical protein
MTSGDFAGIIGAMAPGDMVHLSTWRNGELIELAVILAAGQCPPQSPRPPQPGKSGSRDGGARS